MCQKCQIVLKGANNVLKTGQNAIKVPKRAKKHVKKGGLHCIDATICTPDLQKVKKKVSKWIFLECKKTLKTKSRLITKSMHFFRK